MSPLKDKDNIWLEKREKEISNFLQKLAKNIYTPTKCFICGDHENPYGTHHDRDENVQDFIYEFQAHKQCLQKE